MTGLGRKIALAAHLVLAVGWIGAVLAFLPLALARAAGAAGAFEAMVVLLRWVILPLAFGALASGIVSGLSSPWGLVRHWWVIIKLALTLVAIAVLVAQVGPIEELAHAPAVGHEALRPLVHAGGGLALLLAIHLIGVFKPWGPTRRGRPAALKV